MQVAGPAAHQRREVGALGVNLLQVAADTEVGAVGAQQHGAQTARVPEIGEHLLEVAREFTVERVATLGLRQAHDSQAVFHLDAD